MHSCIARRKAAAKYGNDDDCDDDCDDDDDDDDDCDEYEADDDYFENDDAGFKWYLQY